MTEHPARHEARREFLTALLAHANAQANLHSTISATRDSWIGAQRHGHSWKYVVLQTETRVELYIKTPVAAANKALFDSLHAQRATVEAAFGSPLAWQRLDDKRASRISFSVPGGCVKGGVKLDHSGGEKVDQFRGGGSFDLRGSCEGGFHSGLTAPPCGRRRPPLQPPPQLPLKSKLPPPLNWSTFSPPEWSSFTPPLTLLTSPAVSPKLGITNSFNS